MIHFTKDQLIAKAVIRPQGYVEDVLAHALPDRGALGAETGSSDLYLSDADWQFLRTKYRRITTVPLVSVEEVQRRFEICKTCDQSKDSGFSCDLHKACCFGRWRANPNNQCPIGKWLSTTVESGAKS